MQAADDLRELGRFDALLLTFKAHQWPEFLAQLRPFADTPATIVTLQNGVPFWYVREPPLRSVDPGGVIGGMFPDDRVVGGVVHVSGELPAPGFVRQSGGLRYVLGRTGAGGDARAEAIVRLLRGAGLAAELDPDYSRDGLAQAREQRGAQLGERAAPRADQADARRSRTRAHKCAG